MAVAEPCSRCPPAAGVRALKYLDAGDGGNLFLQEIHPGAELLSDEVPAAASLQLGDQALVGQPELLSVIRSRHPGDGALKGTWSQGDRRR